MTGPERDQLAALEVRLFGLDGESGAIGRLEERLQPVEEFYQQAIGVLRVVKWLGATFLLTLIVGAAKVTGLL